MIRWEHWREDIEALQAAYLLVQPSKRYFFAVVLEGQDRRDSARLIAKRYDIPLWKKRYRRRKGRPNFRLLMTHPLLVLANPTRGDDPDLLAEVEYFESLFYKPRVVDLRQGWVELELFRVGSWQKHCVITPSKAAVREVLSELSEIEASYGHDVKSAFVRVNRVLRRVQRIYRFVQADAEFRRIQEAAELVILRSLARRDGITLDAARKRYVSASRWGNMVRPTVVISRRRKRTIKLFNLRLAKTGIKYWAYQRRKSA